MREIKFSELRIGNLIFEKGTDSNEGGLFFDGTKEVVSVDLELLNEEPFYYDPIPLTEKWLTDFGFKWQKPGAGGQDQWAGYGYWWLDKGEFSLIGTKTGNVWFGRCNDWKINFVHELQNLYFALEKKELTPDVF